MLLPKVSKIILLSVCLLGCSALNPSEEKQVTNLRYYKDDRTNLCFVHNSVTSSNGWTYDIFTHVPCTTEVEELIKKNKK